MDWFCSEVVPWQEIKQRPRQPRVPSVVRSSSAATSSLQATEDGEDSSGKMRQWPGVSEPRLGLQSGESRVWAEFRPAFLLP